MAASKKLRIAVVGCGQIADAHLAEIRKIECADLVAVCDSQRDLAEQAAARFEVPRLFDDLNALLNANIAEVIHLTTPAHTHAALATQVLNAGLHVYVEKPFTANVAEADCVFETAQRANRLVCAGHNLLFDPAWMSCRKLLDSGELGDVVHVESVMGYDLSGVFGRLVARDPHHWVRRLPGSLFQNVAPHPLYRVMDAMPDDQPEIIAFWQEDFAASQPVCEVRAILRGRQVTGGITFSSAIKPSLQLTRVYGTKKAVEVDFDGRVLRQYRPVTSRGPFIPLEVPFRQLREACGTLFRNGWKFTRGELQFFAGMNLLFRRFYGAILQQGPAPIPYADIRRVVAAMDALCRFRRPSGLPELKHPDADA